MIVTRSRRAVWIVLDGVGIGAQEDSGDYGDSGAATLPHVAAACNGLSLPVLQGLGLGNLASIAGVPPLSSPVGGYGRLRERAVGKDSVSGHWELAGVTLVEPFATFPYGFPQELISSFAIIAGLWPLGNVVASGTAVLDRFGAEHLASGRPIVYTSVDSVFQIAAHRDVTSRDELYRICSATRELCDPYRIGRVIARPFAGNPQDGFARTPDRKDFPMPPPAATLLDRLSDRRIPVWAVGKIYDLFAGHGIVRHLPTRNNQEGMCQLLSALDELPQTALLAANLIDFDMVYGHRRDAAGFGRALEAFDAWLPELQARMAPGDLLLVTADHGCDPLIAGTDHTREQVPVLAWSPQMRSGVDLGERASFADVGATLAEFFGLPVKSGESFLGELS